MNNIRIMGILIAILSLINPAISSAKSINNINNFKDLRDFKVDVLKQHPDLKLCMDSATNKKGKRTCLNDFKISHPSVAKEWRENVKNVRENVRNNNPRLHECLKSAKKAGVKRPLKHCRNTNKPRTTKDFLNR